MMLKSTTSQRDGTHFNRKRILNDARVAHMSSSSMMPNKVMRHLNVAFQVVFHIHICSKCKCTGQKYSNSREFA